MRRFVLLAAALLAAPGCASKYARFHNIPVAQSDPRAAFNATQQVLSKYFDEFATCRPSQGLLTTGKSRLYVGKLPKDSYVLVGTVIVEPRKDHCVVRVKVQKSQVRGQWSWLGLGTHFQEKEVLAGEDNVLIDKIAEDLTKSLGAFAGPGQTP